MREIGEEREGIWMKIMRFRVGLGMEYERKREKLLQVDWNLIGRRDGITIV